MQFKFFALSFLAGAAMADDNLTEIVDSFQACSLPCFAQKADGEGCKTSDIDCICDHKLAIVTKMGSCLADYCGDATNSNVGDKIDELCERFDDHPSSTEVAAATSALASHVTAASATVTPAGAAGTLEPGMAMIGAAAAAALMI